MSAPTLSPCPKCGADQGEGKHRHCGGCSVLLVKGKSVKHADDCPKLGLQRGQFCPKCRRLLAAGAFCPDHGDPLAS